MIKFALISCYNETMSRKTELIWRNILNENDLIETEMITAKLSNVRTNNGYGSSDEKSLSPKISL